jgi:hypothetical protein
MLDGKISKKLACLIRQDRNINMGQPRGSVQDKRKELC